MFAADDFKDDWYGYLTNQIGHIVLGVALSWLACAVVFLISGVLPFKVPVFAVIAIAYFSYELYCQGWVGSDTIEDTMYVSLYGSGVALNSFSEIYSGSAIVAFDIIAPAPILAVAVVHLVLGCYLRYRHLKKNGGA